MCARVRVCACVCVRPSHIYTCLCLLRESWSPDQNRSGHLPVYRYEYQPVWKVSSCTRWHVILYKMTLVAYLLVIVLVNQQVKSGEDTTCVCVRLYVFAHVCQTPSLLCVSLWSYVSVCKMHWYAHMSFYKWIGAGIDRYISICGSFWICILIHMCVLVYSCEVICSYTYVHVYKKYMCT